MNDLSNQHGKRWWDRLPLPLAIGLGGFLFIYFIIPGFALGLLFKANILDPTTQDQHLRSIIQVVFCLPFYLGEKFEFIGNFYEWQCYVVSGYR